MSHDEFTKLCTLIEKIDQRLDRLEAELAKKVNQDEMHDLFDAVHKRFDVVEQELATVTHRVNHHEWWHHQTAQKVGINLSE